MFRRPIVVAFMVLLSFAAACAPQAGSPTPTPGGTGAVPKATSGAVSVATPGTAAGKPQRGGTLIFAQSGEAPQLDPALMTQALNKVWTRYMYNTLVQTNESGDIIPELATSWSSPDPQTLELKLREGVKFHDGTDFNSQAVKFNIERILDPATKVLKSAAARVAGIESVQIVDDYTVRLHFKTPQPLQLVFLGDATTGGMVSPSAVKKWGDLNLHPVGTGPFEFVDWFKGDHLTLKRFDGYWRKDQFGDPLPYLDGLLIKPIPDGTVRLANLRTGAADLVDSIIPSQLPTVKADSKLKTAEWGTIRFKLMLNNAMPPFNNKALRQAVDWAIDREAIHKAIYGGTGEPAIFFLDSKSWGFDPTIGKVHPKDNAKAKDKLAEAGMPAGFKFTALSFNTDLELRVVQAIKAQLAEVGIDMELVPLETGELAARRVAGKDQANFTQGGPLYPDPDEIYSYLHSKGENNAGYIRYSNPQVDDLLEKARQASDKAERKSLYAKVQAITQEDVPFINIHNNVTISAMKENLMGFTPTIANVYQQVDWLWLKK